jgi:hypothetical protein
MWFVMFRGTSGKKEAVRQSESGENHQRIALRNIPSLVESQRNHQPIIVKNPRLKEDVERITSESPYVPSPIRDIKKETEP